MLPNPVAAVLAAPADREDTSRERVNRRLLVAFAIGVSLAGHGVAQSSGIAVRLRGNIDSLSGNTFHLTLRSGDKVTAVLATNPRLPPLTPVKPTDIAKRSYIGTAAAPQPDGALRALEVEVFPPSMRGVGDGSRPFDAAPGSSMTNGTVGSMVSANGRILTVTYKGGENRIVVPDGVPFVTYVPADCSALTPCVTVLVIATHAPDGTVMANSVLVGKNGLVPPI